MRPSPRALDLYVGTPWQERGRVRAGCDCWGLVGIVYFEQLGIELPSHADDYSSTSDREALEDLLNAGRPAWRAVPLAEAMPYDVVLLRARSWHVGIVRGAGAMLHMPRGQSAVIEPFTTGRHWPAVEGIYAYEGRL